MKLVSFKKFLKCFREGDKIVLNWSKVLFDGKKPLFFSFTLRRNPSYVILFSWLKGTFSIFTILLISFSIHSCISMSHTIAKLGWSLNTHSWCFQQWIRFRLVNLSMSSPSPEDNGFRKMCTIILNELSPVMILITLFDCLNVFWE